MNEPKLTVTGRNLPTSEAFRKRNPELYGKAGDQGPGACAVVQKQQVDIPKSKRKTIHRDKTKTAGVDGQIHPTFRIAIILRFSDGYARDADGSVSTVMDCIVDASRRFMAMGK